MLSTKTWMPLGLVQLRESAGQHYRLGTSRYDAVMKALSSQLSWEARWSNLDLLPAKTVPTLETVIDVGANDCSWSRVLLRYGQPKTLIVVEPNPKLGDSLKALERDFPQVTTLGQAVGERVGTMPFHITGHSHNSSILKPSNLEGGFYVTQTVDVPVITLDALTAKLDHIDLLKLDLQGYELFALKGAKAMLPKTKYVLIEVNFTSAYDGMALFPQVHQEMVSNGFVLANLSQPVRENGRAIWADALYLNPAFA